NRGAIGHGHRRGERAVVESALVETADPFPAVGRAPALAAAPAPARRPRARARRGPCTLARPALPGTRPPARASLSPTRTRPIPRRAAPASRRRAGAGPSHAPPAAS